MESDVDTRARILVIRGGAIGDFILTLPVLAALRAQFPQARLELLGYPHIARLALAGGLVRAVHTIEAGPLAAFFAREGELDVVWSAFFARFGLIISFLYDPDGVFQENVGRCSQAQFLNGPHRPEEGGAVHATRVYLRVLERLAIFDADPVPRLELAEGGATAATPPVLALHPGSGSERKNWPEGSWAELLQKLAATTNQHFLLVGGEAEGNRLERLATLVPAARLRLARSLPLSELACQLASCSGFVGHDSGISHLAATLGVPTLVLWGDTAEAVWRPAGEHVTVLRGARGLTSLEVQAVRDAIGRMQSAA